MRIIVNRGLTDSLARIEIYRNGVAIVVRCTENICYDFEAEQGDKIEVKLKYVLHTRPVANFVCGGADDIVCVCTTRFCQKWEWVSCMLLAVSLFAEILWNAGALPEWMQCVIVGLVVLMAVSIVALRLAKCLPGMRSKLFVTLPLGRC